MPNYPYRCTKCEHTFEVAKRVADIDLPESCEKCQAPADRYIGRTHFYGASDWDRAEFNPGLGCVTKNAKHRKEIARQKGLQEVGNDYREPDNLHKHQDSARHEKWERGWAAV